MKKQPPMAERLLAKLQKLGVSARKARELAKGIAPTATRAKVSGTVTGKLTEKLVKLGLSERKATELAKGLAPVVRAAIKAKVKAEAKTLDDMTDAEVADVVLKTIDETEDAQLDKVAPRVNGHRVRLDLPVIGKEGGSGLELLRVMHGLSSTATYLVAAVKGESNLVAVRKLGSDWYNVKFYPNMRAWDRTPEKLGLLGAVDYLEREWYQRMHMDEGGLTKLLGQLAAEAKPKSTIKALMGRFKAITATPLIKAFGYLAQLGVKAA